jgi:hypothetical protein
MVNMIIISNPGEQASSQDKEDEVRSSSDINSDSLDSELVYPLDLSLNKYIKCNLRVKKGNVI